MIHQKLRQKLLAENFDRIERDDRLHDVFPNQGRDKDIELWEKWGDEKVDIVRIHLPKMIVEEYLISRQKLEQYLRENKQVEISSLDQTQNIKFNL